MKNVVKVNKCRHENHYFKLNPSFATAFNVEYENKKIRNKMIESKVNIKHFLKPHKHKPKRTHTHTPNHSQHACTPFKICILNDRRNSIVT